MSTTGKTALVTGSSSGIGYAVAQEFLAAGWNVVLNGRDEGRLHEAARKLGNAARVVAVAGSTSDVATGTSMVRAARDRFGSVDVLVNNAGEFAGKPFLDVGEADLDHYLDVNLKGTYFTTQTAVRAMIEQGRGGSIVNITTVLIDHAMSWVTATAPLITKGAIRALTVLLAGELAPHDIRVNAVAPGFILTPLMEGGNVAPLAAASTMQRVGEAGEIATAVRFLAESSFITGHVMNVDGGFVTSRR
jgi:NAD(P)-dependent dehydrogenase (short-subunit alcohol dehydrogenase family)